MSGTQKPSEIRALAGARALPPLILVLFHYCEGRGYFSQPWFDLLAGKGYLWVEFFFALSGFILTYVYGARTMALGSPSYWTFIKARLARLYPLHLAVLLIMLAMVIATHFLGVVQGQPSIYEAPYGPNIAWPGFIASLFLVQAWHVLPYLSWNGASWFVSVEFFLCLIFPLFLMLQRKGGFRRAGLLLLAGAAGLITLSRVSGHGLDITYDWGILRGMAAFAIGVALAMFHRGFAKQIEPLHHAVHSAAQIAALGLLFYGIYFTGWAHKPEDVYVVFPMMLLIFTLSYDKGILAQIFHSKPMLLLGEWSYGIYIGQAIVLQGIRITRQQFYPGPWTPEQGLIEAPLALLACILLGALLTRFIEKPANNWLRGHKKQASTPAS